MMCEGECESMENLVKKKDFNIVVRTLENGGGRRLVNCQKFPDVIILLLEGYTKEKVPEEKILSILINLKRKRVLTKEQMERVKSLEAYSFLRKDLSPKIVLELI